MNKIIKLDKNEEKEIEKKILKSKIKILINYPFFGILSVRLKVVQDYEVKTMGVDGVNLYYCPTWIKELSQNELNWVIIHEIMHCALRHIWRCNNRVKKVWNQACDYAIHSIMMQDTEHKNIISMPQNKNKGLYNPRYDNMSAEEIYDELINNQDDNEETLDNHSIWGKTNDENTNDIENQWQMAVINAANTVSNDKNHGNMPGYFKRYIDKLTNPTKDWRILLREFIEPEPNDYTFIKPDYRFDYDEFGCFLPSFNDEQEKVNKILFWIDTSGSINNDELNKIYSEVAGAVEQFDFFEGYLGFFDSKAYEPKLFNDFNSLNDIKPVGGGGTNFHVPFEFANNNEEFNDVKCNIILTDGYCDFPSEDITDTKTIWLITTKDIQAPWGHSIYLSLNEN